MKIAVLNYTGTVGKTTIAAHLLAPRMNNAQIFAIETVNETAEGLGMDVEKIRGAKFRDLFKRLVVADDAIVDVGASNVEEFLQGLVKFEDSHLEFDYFVVPTTSGSKEQKETMSMLHMLAQCGIAQNKIRLIFNRVDRDVDDEFGPLLNFVKKQRVCTVDTKAAIFENELFDMLSSKKTSMQAVLADEADYKALARQVTKEGDTKKAALYSDLHVMRSLARTVSRNLDDVYEALFAPQAVPQVAHATA